MKIESEHLEKEYLGELHASSDQEKEIAKSQEAINEKSAALFLMLILEF